MSRSVIYRFSSAGFLTFIAALVGGQGGSSPVMAAISDYQLTRNFTLPTDNTPFSIGALFGSLPSGQLLVLNESQVLTETSVGSGTFNSVGTLSNFNPSGGPSFLAVSPDGTKAAAGTNGNGSITVFNPSNVASSTNYNVSFDFDAAWFNNTLLAISDGNGVQILNTSNGSLATVVSDIGGASGGITFDSAGNLYTGDGFYFGAGPSQTGLIKEFSKASWQSALSSMPLDFESAGTPVAQLLSASSIGFDNAGNFFAGGADFFGTTGNFGYNALVSADAIQEAIASSPTIGLITGSSPPSVLREFDSPADDISNTDPGFWTYNNATGELDLRYFGDNNVEVFAVPEPGSITLLTLGSGILMFRRRRRTRAGLITLAAGVCAATAVIPQSAQAGYTYNPTDFATTLISSTVPTSTSPYSNSTAILGQPPLTFNGSANPNVQQSELVKIVDPPFNLDLNGNPVLTQLPNFPTTTQITVQMGAPISHNPAHPYGDDLIVFGNSFYLGGGAVDDTTNLNNLTLSGGIFSHPVQVSVSPDNVNWFTFPVTAGLQPYNAYQWNDATASWTTNELNPTVPLNPSVYTTNFAGDTAAQVLDAYGNSAGGTAFDLDNALDSNGMTLAQYGYNSIDYVRVSSTSSGYAVIAGISAVSTPISNFVWIPEPADMVVPALGGLALLRSRRA
jgi:hypothetical protein